MILSYRLPGILLGALGSLVAHAQPGRVVFSGHAAGPSAGERVYLYNRVTNEADSATIDAAGRFTLSRPFKVPTRYLFYTSYDRRVHHGYTPYGILVAEPGTVRVAFDIGKGFAASAVAEGSEPQRWYEAFLAAYGRADSLGRPAVLTDFVTRHATSYAAALVLQRYGSELPVGQQERLLNALPAASRQGYEGQAVRQSIAGRRNAEAGGTPPDFTLPDAQGRPRSLASLRGKYVLLDFWASWCGPCHAEFPALRALYAQYQARGFEIWSISTDKNADAWLRDLQKQQLPWPQARDARDAVASGQFGVSALPTSFLLDPQGRLVAKDLRGEALAQRLQALLPAGPPAPAAPAGSPALRGRVGQLGPPAMLYLSYEAQGQYRQDSVRLQNGAFSFDKLRLTEPGFATLYLSRDGRYRPSRRADLLTLYLGEEPLRLEARDSICQAALPATPLNRDYAALEARLRPIDRQRSQLYQERDNRATAPPRLAALEQQLTALGAQRQAVFREFVVAHPASLTSLDALKRLGGAFPDYPAVLALFNGLAPAVRASEAGRRHRQELTVLSATAIGATAPDFTQASPTGQPVSLHDFRGQYVLVDFWASWCGPCRAENPNLVRAYQKYKAHNFTILGVSLDRPSGRQSWLTAIQRDGLTWPQVSDLHYLANAAAVRYGVTAIPQNFLLDPQGRVIAKNIKGEELEKALATLLPR